LRALGRQRDPIGRVRLEVKGKEKDPFKDCFASGAGGFYDKLEAVEADLANDVQ
jgi:hypothetical protein